MDAPGERPTSARGELFAEVEELVEEARRAVDALTLDPVAWRADAVFRPVHSLKGVAGTFGLDALGLRAHALEEALDAVRRGARRVDDDALGELDAGIEALAAELSAARDGGEEVRAIERGLTAAQASRLRANLAAGVALHRLRGRLPIEGADAAVAAAVAAVESVGEPIGWGSWDAPTDGSLALELTFASRRGIDELRAVLERDGWSVSTVTTPSPVAQGAGEAPLTLRVDIARLDALLDATGDLGVLRVELQTATELARAGDAPGAARELARIQRSLGRAVDRVQRGVIEARLVPLGEVVARLAREVQRSARAEGRPLRFVADGAETALDKRVVERLAAPLLHLVRNALSHGIEPPEARVAAGKPREGNVSLRARQVGGHAVIEVADDGGGVDVARVRDAARAAGAPAPRDDAEAIALLFRPGISTRAEADARSGRGVGLDVVRTELAALGGVVDLATEPGRGTRVTLTLPVAISLQGCLFVSCAGRRYGVATATVAETLRLPAGDHGASLDWRGRAVPLVDLARRLGHRDGPGARYAVVLAMAGRAVGVAVDEVAGQRDVVVKPLGPSLRGVRGFVGAAELGARRVALVLDAAELLQGGAP